MFSKIWYFQNAKPFCLSPWWILNRAVPCFDLHSSRPSPSKQPIKISFWNCENCIVGLPTVLPVTYYWISITYFHRIQTIDTTASPLWASLYWAHFHLPSSMLFSSVTRSIDYIFIQSLLITTLDVGVLWCLCLCTYSLPFLYTIRSYKRSSRYGVNFVKTKWLPTVLPRTWVNFSGFHRYKPISTLMFPSEDAMFHVPL